MSHELPPQTRDQLDAAARETLRSVEAVGADPDGRPLVDHPALEARIAATFEAVSAGTAQYCRHLDANPRPMHVRLADPGALYCADCAAAFDKAAADTPLDGMCDICHEYDPAAIHVVVASRGPVAFKGGFCAACLQRTDD